MYSIGSSIVMILQRKALLIRSIIAARVVLLPLPVVPVTSVSPRSESVMSRSTGGSWSSSIVRTLSRTTRMTIAGVPRWLYTLQRNRQRRRASRARSRGPRPSSRRAIRPITPGLIDEMNCRSSSAETGGDSTVRIRPSIRNERRRAGLEVDVRGALFHGELDQLIEIHASTSCSPVLNTLADWGRFP